MQGVFQRWQARAGSHDKTLVLVYLSTAIFGFTAIAHQNNLGAVSSLLAGDSITQYGWIIGLTLLGLGLGFFVSRRIADERLITTFITTEIALTLVSGFSVVLAFWGYSNLPAVYIWFLRLVSLVIAVIIGIEDAMLVRIAEQRERDVAQSVGLTFWFSNIGGALAGFTFGQLLVPQWGIFNLALLLGVLDGLMVVLNLLFFRPHVPHFVAKCAVHFLIIVALCVTLLNHRSVTTILTQSLYEDKVVKEWSGAYGSKVLTCSRSGSCKLFMNGQLQFSSKDEYQYHERLTHPAMAVLRERIKNRPINVLIAGGGDGLAARELLKYPEVGSVQIVDLDPDMTNRVAVEEPVLTYNQGALHDPRVSVYNTDAFTFVRDSDDQWDLIVVDLVDPDSESTAKLYAEEFYRFGAQKLAYGGVFITQSTSPWYAPRAFWTINLTLNEVFQQVVPLRWNVPSFGDWGWNMASSVPFNADDIRIDETKTRGLTTEGWRASLVFEREEWTIRDDLKAKGITSTLTSPAVLLYYREPGAWDDWGEVGGK